MFNLRAKFFIALLSLSAVLTLALYAFFSFSFERDFWRYIEDKEIARAAPLIEMLEEHYREQGGWSEFHEHPDAWTEFLTSFILEGFRERQRDTGNMDRLDNLPPERFNRRMHALFRSVVLLDTSKQIIAGDERVRRHMYHHKLKVGSEIVGYLGMPMNPALRDLQDAKFAGDQTSNLAFIALAAFFIALVTALPLSHFLTKRIHALVLHVQKLSDGKYDHTIKLSGADELTKLAEHLNHLARILQNSEQSRRSWVADISHELRTPLSVLQADIEAMQDGVRSLDENALTRLQQHTRRLTTLVQDLYDLSLTDIGALTYRKHRFDFFALVQESVTIMQPQFEQQQLAVTINTLSGKNAFVLADSQRLQQLCMNLLQNSLNYTHSPGKISIDLIKDNQEVVLVIEDSSPGVDEGLHEKLFDRLYRAESSRNRETGGAGLGLTLCKNITEAHGGTITISNSELGGLKVTLTLPLSKA